MRNSVGETILSVGKQHTTWDLGGGRRRFETTIHDQRYRVAGQWADVVEDAVVDGQEGFARVADRMRHRLRLAEDGTRRWFPDRNGAGHIEFGRPQYRSGSSWLELTLGTPVADARSLVWDRPNFKLSLLHNWHKSKLELVLKSSAAARRVRWPVTLNGLTWDNWRLLAGGVPVAYVEPIRAWDANGIAVPIAASYAGGFLEFTATVSGATYPITIDPTLTLQPDGTDGIDSFVNEPNADANFGTDTELWDNCFLANDYRALIAFDLSSLPADATVDDATETLTISNNDVDFGVTATIKVYRLKLSWTEAGVTWNSRNGTNNWSSPGAFHADDCEQTEIGTFQTVNWGDSGAKTCAITAASKADLDLGYGWLHKGGEGGVNGRVRWCSSDHATAASRPKLVINYTVASGGGKPWFIMFQ